MRRCYSAKTNFRMLLDQEHNGFGLAPN